MKDFPVEPIPAHEFVEEHLPRVLGAPALAAGAAGLRARLGLSLSGKGGGVWTLVLRNKGLEIESGGEAPLTVGMSAKDWRGALWEERGAAVGGFLAQAFGSGESRPSLGAPLRFDIAVLDRLADLDATLRLVVTEGKGGDWSLDVRLGPGPVAGDPQLVLRASAACVDALAAGEQEVLTAIMTGRVRVEGEMSLLLQIQALLLQARG
jgi:hypothetical protein